MESIDEWHRRDPGRRDKNGRLYRTRRRVERWEWGEDQEKSVLVIKRAVMENAVFGGDEEIQYHLATDVSKLALGEYSFNSSTAKLVSWRGPQTAHT